MFLLARVDQPEFFGNYVADRFEAHPGVRASSRLWKSRLQTTARARAKRAGT